MQTDCMPQITDTMHLNKISRLLKVQTTEILKNAVSHTESFKNNSSLRQQSTAENKKYPIKEFHKRP